MPSEPVDYFRTPRAAVFDKLLDAGRSPADAVSFVRTTEQDSSIPPASIYGSTSITSGGYKRDATLSIEGVIAANNRAAGHLMGALVSAPGVVTSSNTMVPTEIGKMRWPDGRSWTDTDYMIFYFAYATGLSSRGATLLHESIAVTEFEPILAVANDRSIRDNEKRWPAYRAFTDIALGKLAGLLRTPSLHPFEAFEVMLQLVDVGLSLGCRSERRFASYFGLDLILPAIDKDQLTPGDPLTLDIEALTDLGAQLGVPAHPIMPVAEVLNPRPSVL